MTNALASLGGMTFDDLVERIAERVAAKLETPEKTSEPVFLDLKGVTEYTGLSSTTINRMVAAGDFPSPDYGGGKGGKRGWRTERVRAWAKKERV